MSVSLRSLFTRILLLCIFTAGIIPTIHAQQDDAGLWASVSVKHQVTRRMSVGISEQIRLYQNVSEVDQFFTDIGIDYDLLSSLKVSVSYRLTSKNQLTYYQTRHRGYIDLTYKKKLKPLSLSFRQRLQSQVEAVNSSDNGKVPEWYTRSKLTVKLDLDKKYSPYLATEYYYLVDNLKESDHVFDKARYEIGIDYDFNRRSSLNLFYLIQKDLLENKTRDFVSGIGYSYSF